NTTVVSIGHRSSVLALHSRRREMSAEGGHFALRDAGKVLRCKVTETVARERSKIYGALIIGKLREYLAQGTPLPRRMRHATRAYCGSPNSRRNERRQLSPH